MTVPRVIETIRREGLLIVGCGRMGGALLDGWIDAGLDPKSVTVMDPSPSERLEALVGLGLSLNRHPVSAGCILIAVKPQNMVDVLPYIRPLCTPQSLIISIAAGVSIDRYEATFGRDAPIVRAMPNTPVAVGRGVTALIANAAGQGRLSEAEALFTLVGCTFVLSDEAQMDAVTAVSGSGPAYLFCFIEALGAAAQAAGLPADLSQALARQTVGGASELAYRNNASATELREAVTSPGGTTAAALAVLMRQDAGLAELVASAVEAAAKRSEALRDA